MANFVTQIPKTIQMMFYVLDWTMHPTHTESALRAVEGFLNAKKSYPRISEIMNNSPDLKMQFESQDFVDDMSKNWDFEEFVKTYKVGSFGYEFGSFMQKLGYKSLEVNLSDSVPNNIQNLLKLGVRNHDAVHFLLGLYDQKDNKYEIRDYHEWVFLAWANAISNQKEEIIKIILKSLRFASWLRFQNTEFNHSQKIGTALAKDCKDLNLIWLKPYFELSCDQAKKELGVTSSGKYLQNNKN